MAKLKTKPGMDRITEIVDTALAASLEKILPKLVKPKFFSMKSIKMWTAVFLLISAAGGAWAIFNNYEEGRIKRREDIEMIPTLVTSVDLVAKRLDTVIAKDKWQILRRVERHDSLLNLEYKTVKVK